MVALNALLSDHSSSETLTLACRVGAILGKGGQTITKIRTRPAPIWMCKLKVLMSVWSK